MSRNVSSDGAEARQRLRECEGLVDALLHALHSAVVSKDTDNKVAEVIPACSQWTFPSSSGDLSHSDLHNPDPIMLVYSCSAITQRTPAVLTVVFCHCPRCSRWRTASASCGTFPIMSTRKSPAPSNFRSPISSGQRGTRRRRLSPTVQEGNAPKVGS